MLLNSSKLVLDDKTLWQCKLILEKQTVEWINVIMSDSQLLASSGVYGHLVGDSGHTWTKNGLLNHITQV